MQYLSDFFTMLTSGAVGVFQRAAADPALTIRVLALLLITNSLICRSVYISKKTPLYIRLQVHVTFAACWFAVLVPLEWSVALLMSATAINLLLSAHRWGTEEMARELNTPLPVPPKWHGQLRSFLEGTRDAFTKSIRRALHGIARSVLFGPQPSPASPTRQTASTKGHSSRGAKP